MKRHRGTSLIDGAARRKELPPVITPLVKAAKQWSGNAAVGCEKWSRAMLTARGGVSRSIHLWWFRPVVQPVVHDVEPVLGEKEGYRSATGCAAQASR
jgi:hypothetical protein